MEMEGRGLSDLFRNTSEEIFLKAVMENSMGVAAAPSMEMLGFKNMSQGFGSVNNRPRQPSRLSSEAAAGLPNQQHDIAQQNFLTDNLVPQNLAIPSVEYPNNHNQQSLKNAAEKGMQASDLLLAKEEFINIPLDNPHMAAQDTVTSVVSMLKDTLERKKLGSHANKDTSVGNSFGFYDTQQFQQNIIGGTDFFPIVTTAQVQDSLMLPKVERPMEPNNAGFEMCDELPPTGQAMSVCESTRKNAANGTTDCKSKGKEYREKVQKDTLKDERKKAALTRMGSISSEQAADNGDPTKKRRVERSRKMAEVKGKKFHTSNTI
ncbi:unnamed protein product [Miscanthus lutarioriparius]|uniref:Uncharacterized protein n=1 Tax=Miscanthus lutarioriparius TaxID=422564 RepID=A0A811S6V7_9POAL|nr:unnamed protein product [Miscanthus lutarioriparius]